MDTEIKKIKKYTKFMQKAGVLSLKAAEIEIHLSPHMVSSALSQVKDYGPELKEEEKTEFTDEDLLLWSAPGAH